MSINVSHPDGILKGTVRLPLSKSESNRILILQALSKGKFTVGALSDARDTQLLQAALASDTVEVNIEDAGTAMRFLTAYYCAANQHKILTGSMRMKERPIGILVDALKEIGFDIQYQGKPGYPPLEIKPADMNMLRAKVEIAGDVSSQYISALAMIAPSLKNGLTIYFTTPLVSEPYIDMTLQIMAEAGISHAWTDAKNLSIQHQQFTAAQLSAHADWSAASYWFSMAKFFYLIWIPHPIRATKQ
jgi:3-phosphoshikimate 1-carboxyvinyltransferase